MILHSVCFDSFSGFSVLLRDNLIFRFPLAPMNFEQYEIGQDCWQGSQPGSQLGVSLVILNHMLAMIKGNEKIY